MTEFVIVFHAIMFGGAAVICGLAYLLNKLS